MRRSLLLVGLGLLLGACTTQGSIGGMLVLEGRHTVDTRTTLAGDLAVINGEVHVKEGAAIAGSVYVLGGEVEVAGTVDGDVAVVGGVVRLTDGAVVAGGLRRGGGQVDIAAGAALGATLVSPVAVDAILGLTRPAAEGDGLSGWLGVQVLVIALFAVLVTWLAPRAVARIGRAVVIQPLVPLAVGVLAVIVGVSLLVFMVFTVVLIPVALLLALGSLLGTGIGFVSLGRLSVRGVLGAGALGGGTSIQAALGSGALALAMGLVSVLPLVGEVTVAVVAATALGSWLVTRFGTRELRLPFEDVHGA
jgi:cytoskeletal protein CcmA (bactofilin family)